MMGAYSLQPRQKINQKAQGKKQLAGGVHMYPPFPPPRHLVVNRLSKGFFGLLYVSRTFSCFTRETMLTVYVCLSCFVHRRLCVQTVLKAESR